jgi:hypothetical protein
MSKSELYEISCTLRKPACWIIPRYANSLTNSLVPLYVLVDSSKRQNKLSLTRLAPNSRLEIKGRLLTKVCWVLTSSTPTRSLFNPNISQDSFPTIKMAIEKIHQIRWNFLRKKAKVSWHGFAPSILSFQLFLESQSILGLTKFI